MVVEFAINDAALLHEQARLPAVGVRLNARGRPPAAHHSLHHTWSSRTLLPPCFSLQQLYNSVGRRGFEQLLRRLQAMPSQPSLLLLQLYPWWQAFGDGVTQGLYYREPENQMTVLGQASGRLCWNG